MKQRVTLTLDAKAVSGLDEIAAREHKSRSALADSILMGFVRQQRRVELARQAEAFFSQPESADETEERAAWERLGLEVLSREP
jgi:metal-responsive CopG/Arc/MetJ family transcriptional regulator